MITEQALQEAIAECQGERNPNRETCMMLAAFYTIQDRLYPKERPSYSFAPPPTDVVTSGAGTVGDYGISDFLRAVKGKDEAMAWAVMDELMDTLLMVNKRLYESIMAKLNK